jgi:two-component system sensor kinase FixL
LLLRAPTRMATDRRTFGFSVLFAVILLAAIAKAAFIQPPVESVDAMLIGLLAMAGLAAGAVAVWSMHAAPDREPLFSRRELMDAVELAAVMVLDEDNIIRHWSRGCEELYGWSAAEAIGRSRVDLLHTETENTDDLWRQLRVRGRMHNEVIERHRDGRELVIHDHIKLFNHPDGRSSAVIAVTDVTQWRRTEAALRISEARLATAVSVQGIFIYEYDLVAERMIWTTRGDDFAAYHWSAWDDLGPRLRQTLDAAIAEGRDRAHYDFEFSYSDGSRRLAEGWARIIRDADRRPIRLLGTHLDVTERREREEALRAGEAERRAILTTVPDAMFVCSDRGFIRACSASACRLFGYEESELLGRQVSDFIEDPRGADAVRHDFGTAIDRGPETPWPLLLNVRCASGDLVPVSFVIGDAKLDEMRMFVVLGRDMRPAIANEERFHRLNNDLAQVSRLGMMGEMAGGLAHELSQPLSAIVNFLGAAELILDHEADGDTQRLRHAISRASEQASRAGEIIRRLRAFILRGEADMRAEPLTSLVREAAALALFNTSTFGVRLSYQFESEDRLVLGDRIQIQQVLVNLIRNAADAMAGRAGDRRDLMISTTMARDNLIEISVRDSGPGIAPEILERLFSPFATTKREGLGFGLAISRRIVEAHGGQLSAVPAPDGGAIFRFTLPVMEEEPAL